MANDISWLRVAALCFSALVAAACGQSADTPLTQMVVTIEADEVVASALDRVRVQIFPAGPQEDSRNTQVREHSFSLQDESSRRGPQALFSFGVVRGASDQIRLVVEGFDGGELVIERKVTADFQPQRRHTLAVYLAQACLGKASGCSGLAETCTPTASAEAPAGSCIGIDKGGDSVASPKNQSTAVAERECPEYNECLSPDYPCIASGAVGYSCQGQFAEWPMPDASPGAKVSPSYDSDAVDGCVLDMRTHLLWQRELPQKYDDCERGDKCTWDEAVRVCGNLELDGKRWRLPSMIELISLVDPVQADQLTSSIDPVAFPNSPLDNFWTSSLHVTRANEAWAVSFVGLGSDTALKANLNKVRCVNSMQTLAGTPADRYSVDEEADEIADRRTGLVWQRSLSAQDRSWEAAVERCATRGGGFRLPTAKELLTLVDTTKLSPAVPDVFGDGVEDLALFWSATADPIGGSRVLAWLGEDGSLTTVAGIADALALRDLHVELGYYARCVR